MRKTAYFSVPIVLLVLFFAFLRALDRRSEGVSPAVHETAPSTPPAVDLLPRVEVSSTGDLYLGQNGGGGEFYKGELRDVAVWGRALRDANAVRTEAPQSADGFWPLDGRSPESASDATTNGNHGRMSGGVRWTADPTSKALSFDGSTGFIRIPRAKRLEGSAVTVSCWIRRTPDEPNWANVLRKAWFNNLGPTFMSWSLQLNPDGKGAGTLAFNTGFERGYHTLIAKAVIPEGRWARVVAVYDPAAAAPQKRLYVDGTLVASVEESRPILYDSVRNQWRFEGKDLVSPDDVGVPARLAIPCALPEEYDLTIVARRLRGVEALHVGLRCGKSGCVAVLDALENREYRSGIDTIETRGFQENPSTVSGKQIPDGRPFTLRCSVRRRKITVSLDGAPVLRWEGDPATLSTSAFFQFPKIDALYIGSWETSYRISAVTVSPVLPDAPERP